MIKITIKSLLALALALPLSAAEGYVSKSASGTASAEVFFPGGRQPLRITSVDVTSDAAASTLKFFTGTASATVNKSGADSLTYATVNKVTWASNDLVLIQTAAETVKWNQVSTNTTSTNKLITLSMPLGTNLAIGDTIRKRGSVAYTPVAPALLSADTVFVNSLTGLTTNDVLVLNRAPGLPLRTQTVSIVATNARALVTLKTPLALSLVIGGTVYERATNFFYIDEFTAGEAPELTCTNTIDLADDDYVYVQTAAGDQHVFQCNTVTTNTGILFQGAWPFTPVAYDKVYRLSATSYTMTLPAEPGVNTLILSASTGLASNDVVIVTQSSGQAQAANLAAAPAATNIYTLTFSATNGVAVEPWHAYYKLTNTHTLRLVAAAADYTAVVDTATNLSVLDPVIVLPATGGVFANQLVGLGVDYPVTQLGFTGQVGVALAPGDAIFYVGSTNSQPIGATTIRRDGAAIFAADQGRPVRAVLSGTSACAINNITGVYAP